MFKILLLASFLSSSALAMPNWDGRYLCNMNGKPAGAVTLKTVNGKVTLDGLDTGNSEANAGLPCENVSETQPGPVFTVGHSSTCDSRGLSVAFTAKINGSPSTDFQISLAQVSLTQVKISVFVGDLDAKSGTTIAADCTK